MKTTLNLTIVTLLLAVSNLSADTHYVSLGSQKPKPPYTNWATAATNIQDAVNAAAAGDTVLVTNGVYPGGVVVPNPLRLRSVNGPELTVIDAGGSDRCASLATGASLTGFTLVNGYSYGYDGGGVLCDTNTFLTNCVISGSMARGHWELQRQVMWYFPCYGGGVYGGTLYNCTLTGNSADYGGGAEQCTLYNCTLSGNRARISVMTSSGHVYYVFGRGGGANDCTLYDCTLTGNSAEYGGGAIGGTLHNCTLTGNSGRLGGGAYGGALYNCLLSSNRVAGRQITSPLGHQYYSPGMGGAAYGGMLYNCTLAGNSSTDAAGGTHGGTLYNCLVCSNTATNGANYFTNSVLNFCCTTPMPTNGVGNITNEPAFVNAAAGDFHLQSNSPCINAGNNAYVTTATDLDGHPRIVSGTVDLGAYEYQGTGSVISYAWLQQNGLTTEGSADYTDPDHDGMNNWQEWICDTCPTNAASCLRLTIISNTPPVAVTFSSSAARLYTLLCCTNLTPGSVWTPVPGQSDMPGSGDVLTLTDANPPAAVFYRVSVRFP